MLFTQWCLRRILRIPYTAHVTNDEVRRRPCQPTASHSSHHGETAIHLFGQLLKPATHHVTTCSQSGHQPSPAGLATLAKSTQMNLASNDNSTSTLQQYNLQGFNSCRRGGAGPFQRASICGQWFKCNGTQGSEARISSGGALFSFEKLTFF